MRVSQAYFDVLGAQDTLRDDARQQDRDHRAAGVGQAQLRGRHRDHHRHARGAGALRPRDRAGDRGRQRPATSSGSRSTSWSAAPTSQPNPLAVPVALPARRSPADPDAWVAAAETQHPAIRRARLALDIAQLETEKARAGHLPTLDAVGSLQRRARRDRRHARLDARQQHATRSVGAAAQHAALQRRRDPEPGHAKRSSLEDRAQTTSRRRAAASAQATRQAYFSVQSGAAQVKRARGGRSRRASSRSRRRSSATGSACASTSTC